MKRTIRLTESELNNVIKQILNEYNYDGLHSGNPSDADRENSRKKMRDKNSINELYRIFVTIYKKLKESGDGGIENFGHETRPNEVYLTLEGFIEEALYKLRNSIKTPNF